MARNPYLNKPNGGALKPEATMGRRQYLPMYRKYPKASFLEKLPRDELDELDVPDDVDPDALRRAYLVELRFIEKTWADSHASNPMLRAYYTLADASRVFRVSTLKGIEETDDSAGHLITEEVREKIRSSILVATEGEPAPPAWEDYGPEEVRAQYREVLRDQHGLDPATVRGDE